LRERGRATEREELERERQSSNRGEGEERRGLEGEGGQLSLRNGRA
jgi:hypothetical protein